MRCRDLATAPSTSRGVWSAPACWRCGRAPLRPETSHPTPAFHKPPDGLLTRLHCPFEGRIPPRPEGNDWRKDPVPPGPRDAVERIPPRPDGVKAIPSFGGLAVSSRVVGRAMLWRAGFHPGPCPGAAATHRTPCAAATPHGAFDFAKRLECASLLALSKSDTAPGNLPPRTYLPGPFHARPYSLVSRRHLPSEGRLPGRPGPGAPEQAASA